MWNWFKRKAAPPEPLTREQVIGEVHCVSGTLLLADPMALYAAVRVEGVPPGSIPVRAELIRYPEGGVRVALLRLVFGSGETDTQRVLGAIAVDSGDAAIVDERTQAEHWKEVGPDRVGIATSPKHETVAKLIGRKFGLRHRYVNFIRTAFREPITESLEAEITEYLKTIPEYADYPFMYFRILTNNTEEHINEAMTNNLWCTVSIGPTERDSVFVMTAGFGDGTYPVVGHYRGEELISVEVRFIGPERDKILEAFPILRE